MWWEKGSRSGGAWWDSYKPVEADPPEFSTQVQVQEPKKEKKKNWLENLRDQALGAVGQFAGNVAAGADMFIKNPKQQTKAFFNFYGGENGVADSAVRGVARGVADIPTQVSRGTGMVYDQIGDRNTVLGQVMGLTPFGKAMQNIDAKVAEVNKKTGKNLPTASSLNQQVGDALQAGADIQQESLDRSRFSRDKAGNKVAFDIGQGVTSLLTSVGLAAASGGSSALPSFYTGFTQAGSIYDEAIKKGKSKNRAFFTAAAAGTIEAALEKFGLDEYLRPGGGRIRSTLVRMATEAAQEASQQLGENFVRKYQIDPNVGVFDNVVYAGLLGGVIGGGASFVLPNNIKLRVKEELVSQGVDPQQADEVIATVEQEMPKTVAAGMQSAENDVARVQATQPSDLVPVSAPAVNTQQQAPAPQIEPSTLVPVAPTQTIKSQPQAAPTAPVAPTPKLTPAQRLNLPEEFKTEPRTVQAEAATIQSEYADALKAFQKSTGGVTIQQTDEGGYIRGTSNPDWYREFYKANKRAPNKSDLAMIAHERLLSGQATREGLIDPVQVERYMQLYEGATAGKATTDAEMEKFISELFSATDYEGAIKKQLVDRATGMKFLNKAWVDKFDQRVATVANNGSGYKGKMKLDPNRQGQFLIELVRYAEGQMDIVAAMHEVGHGVLKLAATDQQRKEVFRLAGERYKDTDMARFFTPIYNYLYEYSPDQKKAVEAGLKTLSENSTEVKAPTGINVGAIGSAFKLYNAYVQAGNEAAFSSLTNKAVVDLMRKSARQISTGQFSESVSEELFVQAGAEWAAGKYQGMGAKLKLWFDKFFNNLKRQLGLKYDTLKAMWADIYDAKLDLQFEGNSIIRKAPAKAFIREEGKPTELMATHNLSADNLRNALRLGGIPQASVAIADPKKFAMDGYGEITLVGNNELVDPKKRGTRTYASDVYSPRQPRGQYLADDKSIAYIKDRLAPAMEQLNQEYVGLSPDDGVIETLESDPAAVATFLQERGITPNYGETNSDTRSNFRNQLYEGNLYDEFGAWLQQLAVDSGAPSKIFGGWTNAGRKRLLDDTIDNALKMMRQEARQGGDTTPGLGNIRARITPQFKSIKEIIAAKDRLTDSQKMEEVKKTLEDKLFAIQDKLDQYAGYRNDNQFMEFDNQMEAIGEYMKGDPQFYNQKFPDAPANLKQQLNALKSELQSAPTEYFESVADRAVQINEFEQALVPEDTAPDVVQALEDQGVKVVRYDRNDETARQRLLTEMAAADGQEQLSVGEAEPSEILKQEARKYNSAEEFARSLEYHGTTKENAQGIYRNGFRPGTGQKGISTTQDPDEAKDYGEVVVPVLIKQGAQEVGTPGVDFLTGTGSFSPSDLTPLPQGTTKGDLLSAYKETMPPQEKFSVTPTEDPVVDEFLARTTSTAEEDHRIIVEANKATDPKKVVENYDGLQKLRRWKVDQTIDEIFRDVSKKENEQLFEAAMSYQETGNIPTDIPQKLQDILLQTNQLYQALGDQALADGRIHGLKENYITQIWNEDSLEAILKIDKLTPQQKAYIESMIGTTSRFNLQRSIDTYRMGMELGLTPKYTKLSEIMRQYIMADEKSRVNTILAEDLRKLGEKHVQFSDKQTPAGWRAINNINELRGYSVSPEAWKALRAIESKSAIRENKVTRKILNTVLGHKQIQLAGDLYLLKNYILDAFKVSSFGGARLFFEGGKVDPKLVAKLVSLGGLEMSNYNPETGSWQDNLKQRGKLGKAVGTLMEEKKNPYFWPDYVSFKVGDRFRLGTAVMMYKKAMKSGKYTEAEAAQVAVKYAQNAFGRQNLTRLGRDRTFQDILRTVAISPDYTESRIRYIGKGIKGFIPGLTTKENRRYSIGLIRYAAVNYALLYLLNYALSGHPPDENDEDHKLDLEMRDANGNKYYVNVLGVFKTDVRFVAGLGKMLTGDGSDIWRWFGNKENAFTRQLTQMATNKDWRGSDIVSPVDSPSDAAVKRLNNLVRNFIPLPFQGLVESNYNRPDGASPKGIARVFWNAVGFDFYDTKNIPSEARRALDALEADKSSAMIDIYSLVRQGKVDEARERGQKFNENLDRVGENLANLNGITPTDQQSLKELGATGAIDVDKALAKGAEDRGKSESPISTKIDYGIGGVRLPSNISTTGIATNEKIREKARFSRKSSGRKSTGGRRRTGGVRRLSTGIKVPKLSSRTRLPKLGVKSTRIKAPKVAKIKVKKLNI